MSNEQLMQEELQKAITSVDSATDELSNAELESVAGGVLRPVCFKYSKIIRKRWFCVMRSRRYGEGD